MIWFIVFSMSKFVFVRSTFVRRELCHRWGPSSTGKDKSRRIAGVASGYEVADLDLDDDDDDAKVE